MDVGEPEREIVVEPIEDPVPREEPASPSAPGPEPQVPEEAPSR
jgi:hypothetical protein